MEIDPDVLRRLEEDVQRLEGIEEACERLKMKLGKIGEIKGKVDRIKENPVFLQVFELYSRVYSAELRVKKAKELEILYVTIPGISEVIKRDEYEAFDMIKKIESSFFIVDDVRNQIESALSPHKATLLQIFTSNLKTLLPKLNFPFKTKGEIIATNPDLLQRLKKTIKSLTTISENEDQYEILTNFILQSISQNFLTKSLTNLIEKPEWMLNYSKDLIRLNILYLLETCDIGHVNLDRALNACVSKTVKILSLRLRSDINSAIKSCMESLLLHIIDEILNFDKFLTEIKYPESLISHFLTEDFVAVWVGYEKVYITAEIQKILKPENWALDKVQGMKFRTLDEIFLLHQSLMIKYSVIFELGVKEKLVNSMNETIVFLYISEAARKFEEIKGNFFFYESNPKFWTALCQELAVLHQTLILFQQFLLKIDSQSFAEQHVSINQLKKEILSRVLKLVGDNVDDVVQDFLKKCSDKDLKPFNSKLLKNILKDFKSISTPDLLKVVLSFTLQNYSSTWLDKLKSKKLSEASKSKLITDLKSLFDLLHADSESFESFSQKLRFKD